MNCPLSKIRGVPCDADIMDFKKAYEKSPYFAFVDNNDPEPMIALILTAIDNLEEK